jgi:tRNA threonylcarbamoyl adenosine modification protein YjeE
VRLELASLDDTRALAARLAPLLQPGDVIGLVGDLGAGKTTFVRALIAALGGDAAEVVSPTFTLVQHYATRLPVVHVDAYRLGDDDAFRALGHEELFPADAHGAPTGLTAVEWADLVAASLPPHTLTLRFSAGEGEARTVEASSSSEVLARMGLADGSEIREDSSSTS